MLDALRRLTLRVLRVPPEPQPPAGAPGSVRVFRAGQRYLQLKILGWSIAQVAGIAGALVSFWWVGGLIDGAQDTRREAQARAAAPPPVVPAPPAPRSLAMDGPGSNYGLAPAETVPESTAKAKGKSRRAGHTAFERMAERTPDWMFVVIRALEYWAIALVFLQIPWTFAALRLDYELRWYVVTDRSLRIRHGLLTVRESTLSFVNIQQVVVTQGPLQRYLGLADVRVQSAGGGGGGERGEESNDSLHTAVFHAVDNATEIRDLVLARLRQFRAAGLGDPEDAAAGPALPLAPPILAPATGAALAAARELLAEAQALRRAL